jgi:hypothetical protein
MRGEEWAAHEADCALAARVLEHLLQAGTVYTTLELEGR